MESRNLETILGRHWHHYQADEVVDLLDSHSEKWLDVLEVLERREHFGATPVVWNGMSRFDIGITPTNEWIDEDEKR